MAGGTQSGTATATATTFGAPATGTAPSVDIEVTEGRPVLVTLWTACTNSNAAGSCYVSFDATGGVEYTSTGGSSTTVNVTGFRPPNNNVLGYASGTFLLTATSTGTATLTVTYRAVSHTATFYAVNLVVQAW